MLGYCSGLATCPLFPALSLYTQLTLRLLYLLRFRKGLSAVLKVPLRPIFRWALSDVKLACWKFWPVPKMDPPEVRTQAQTAVIYQLPCCLHWATGPHSRADLVPTPSGTPARTLPHFELSLTLALLDDCSAPLFQLGLGGVTMVLGDMLKGVLPSGPSCLPS